MALELKYQYPRDISMSYKIYNTCVIDDEAHIRKELIDTLHESRDFKVIGEAASVPAGASLILNRHPDVVFLDIKLKQGDAFALLTIIRSSLDKMPAIILNTGYRDFDLAQRAFNEYKDCVLLILKKPFWHNWKAKEEEILKLVQQHYFQSGDLISYSSDHFTITRDYKTWRVYFDELLYIEVPPAIKGGGKINIKTTTDEFVITGSLKNIVADLPPQFIQISRFSIINTKYFRSADHSSHTITIKHSKGKEFKIGKAYKEKLYQQLGLS